LFFISFPQVSGTAVLPFISGKQLVVVSECSRQWTPSVAKHSISPFVFYLTIFVPKQIHSVYGKKKLLPYLHFFNLKIIILVI